MKKFFLTVILILSLLLVSCGEVGEATTPVETTPAATTPTVTTPAATTSAQYPYLFSLTEDGHVLVSKDGNEELSFRLSELEFSSISHPDVTSTYCFDPALVTFCLNQYFPTKIALRLRQREWPAEDAYRIYIDFNDCGFGILYIQKDGQVFFDYLKPYHGNEIDVSYVSEPGVCSYENIAKLYTLLDSPKPINDRCDEFADDTDFLYSLQPDEAGNMIFHREDVAFLTIFTNDIESISMNGFWKCALEDGSTFVGSLASSIESVPEVRQLLSALFPDTISFRRFDKAKEEDLWREDVGLYLSAAHLLIDANHNESYNLYVTEQGRVVLIDTAGHYYVSEPATCDLIEFFRTAEHIRDLCTQKYNAN